MGALSALSALIPPAGIFDARGERGKGGGASAPGHASSCRRLCSMAASVGMEPRRKLFAGAMIRH
jgi:hypothetical protein